MLTGSYYPRTDHLCFNRRIPDEFPFVDYRANEAGHVNDYAVLIEEFLHRCQWAATPFGLVFRQAAMAQVLESIQVLRYAATDPKIRIPSPWFELVAAQDSALPPVIFASLKRLRAIEILQRFLLGVPLGCHVSELHEAVDISKHALMELTPLRFGTFQSWSAHDVVYREDGKPIMNRSTRGIMESHASAYAAELLRASSPGSAGLIDAHIRHNRVGLYRALEELGEAAEAPSLELLPRHILDLADVAISVQLADIPGLPPPADYVDSMLPYVRYQTALRDVHESAEALRLIVEHEPGKLDRLTAQQRLDLIVRNAVTIRGQASGLFHSPVLSRRGVMEQNIGDVWGWSARRQAMIDSTGPVRLIEQMVVDAIAYTSIRFFKIYAETNTDTIIFAPEVDRFILLSRFCDWPVIEYPNGELEVFLCDPMHDPQPIVRQSITVFEVTKILRRLLVEVCDNCRSREWLLTLWRKPLTDLFGVRPEQVVKV